MRVKRLFVLTGVVALTGLLWATPAVADNHLPSITLDPTSVPAEEGDVTITVSGSGWEDPDRRSPFFVTACTRANGDPTVLVDTLSTLANCPNVTGDVAFASLDDSSFTAEFTVTITQDEIDAGAVVILAGWLSTSAGPEDAGVGVLIVADEPAAEEPAAEEPAAEEPAAEEPAAEEPMDDEAMDDEELPVTGAESSLLLIVGAGVLAAGLLVVGAGRRVRTVTR